MSDFENSSKIADYLDEMFSLRPSFDSQVIIAKRNQFVKIAQPQASSHEVRQRKDVVGAREVARKQIEHIVSHFWQLTDAELEEQLSALDTETLPDLKSDVDRLRHTSSLRAEVQWLEENDRFDSQLTVSIKRVLVVPATVATHFREQILQAVDEKQIRKPQKMVSLLKKKCHKLYHREQVWFEEIANVDKRRVEYFEFANIKVNKSHVYAALLVIGGILIGVLQGWLEDSR